MDGAENRLRAAERPKLVVDTGRPSRAEAEAAVRTLLRWAGRRPGARGAGRHAGARRAGIRGMVRRLRHRSRGISAPYVQGDGRLRRDGGAARHRVRIGLRTPCGADHRQGARRLSAAHARGRHLEACARRRGLLEAPADPGEDDGADRKYHQRRAEPARRRGCHRGDASMHDHARDPQGRASAWSPAGCSAHSAATRRRAANSLR